MLKIERYDLTDGTYLYRLFTDENVYGKQVLMFSEEMLSKIKKEIVRIDELKSMTGYDEFMKKQMRSKEFRDAYHKKKRVI